MAFSFIIVILSVFVLANQVNAGYFISSSRLPPQIRAALETLEKPRLPALRPSTSGLAIIKKSTTKSPAKRPLSSPNTIPCPSTTKVDTGSSSAPESALPPQVLAALAGLAKSIAFLPDVTPSAPVLAGIAPPAQRPETLSTNVPFLTGTKRSYFVPDPSLPPEVLAAIEQLTKSGPPSANQPQTSPTIVSYPETLTKVPALAPALAPALETASTPALNLPPDLIALVSTLSIHPAFRGATTPAVAPVAIAESDPVKAAPSALPPSAPPPPTSPTEASSSTSAVPSLDPAFLQNLLKNIVVSPPEICPCGCGCGD